MSRMTRIWFATGLLVCVLAAGCSRKADDAAMQPAASQDSGAAASRVEAMDDGETTMAEPPQGPAGGFGQDAAAIEESPRFPVGEARPRMAPFREEVYESVGEEPESPMTEQPESIPSYAMAEPPVAATAADPQSPENVDPGAAATVAERAVPRMSTQSAPAPQEDYQVVEVFYGTDRARLGPAELGVRDYAHHYRGALGAVAATLVLCGALVLGQQRRLAVGVALIGLVAAGGFGLSATTYVVRSRHAARGEVVQYGDGRGALEMGVAEVSIPTSHRTGELESPSVLRLEFREDPARHVMILSAKAYYEAEFFPRLRHSVDAAPRRELLVFVHGYNVSFDDAVRRTAQIAADVKFGGPAVCYSWPSSGALLAYAADENNVEWTVPHFKEFLMQLREHSGAEAINLVGHSMGTRALADALREFARESQEQDQLFKQVVLAAPDIDAAVFRRDIAPALTKLSHRVTLYASSNDQALMASRRLHAYPRAGESGANLVVAPGLDTIDVSAIDTSLLGHSYYGDNDSIISDLYHLVHDALPPSQRERLEAAAMNGLPYWIFTATARVATPGARSPQ